MAYAFNEFDKSTMARAQGTNLKISLKKSVETLRAIRGKKVSSAIKFLEEVEKERAVVPFLRYNTEMPHKRGKGIAAGGYPRNVARELITLLKNAESNAKEQEVSGTLYVLSASSRKGTRRYRMGRYMGRLMKSTNVEIVVGVKKK